MIEFGGMIIGEYGVGVMKVFYLEMKLKKEGIVVMKVMKVVFDFGNILNLGKVFVKDVRKCVVMER